MNIPVIRASILSEHRSCDSCDQFWVDVQNVLANCLKTIQVYFLESNAFLSKLMISAPNNWVRFEIITNWKGTQFLVPETADFLYFDFVLYSSLKLMISAVSGAKIWVPFEIVTNWKGTRILAPETVDFPYFDFVLYFSSKLMISAVSDAKYQLELPKNPNLKDIKILKK